MEDGATEGLIIVTDLDGTLLDDTYDLEAAAAALDYFAIHGSYSVPASSKTLQELHQLNKLRQEPSPLIFENGAGIAYPTPQSTGELPYRFDAVGPGYIELCQLLDDLRSNLNLAFEGFHDLTDSEVAGYTGLSPAAANLAKQRMFSEPLRWLDSDEERHRLERHLLEQNLQLVSGGRFVHVMPITTKGCAAETVAVFLEQHRPKPSWRIACGDSENDEELLRWADGFVLFPKRDGNYLSLRSDRCVLADAAGAKPWIQAIETLVTKHQTTATNPGGSHE